MLTWLGNLASEQVTKRDVFHIFHRYGRIAQISIKQAYGFVQYYTAEACQAALINQEGADLRGKKIRKLLCSWPGVLLINVLRSGGFEATKIPQSSTKLR